MYKWKILENNKVWSFGRMVGNSHREVGRVVRIKQVNMTGNHYSLFECHVNGCHMADYYNFRKAIDSVAKLITS